MAIKWGGAIGGAPAGGGSSSAGGRRSSTTLTDNAPHEVQLDGFLLPATVWVVPGTDCSVRAEEFISGAWSVLGTFTSGEVFEIVQAADGAVPSKIRFQRVLGAESCWVGVQAAQLNFQAVQALSWADLQSLYPDGGAALLALPAGTSVYVTDREARYERSGNGASWQPFGGAPAPGPAPAAGLSAADFSVRGGLKPNLLSQATRMAYMRSWYETQKALAVMRGNTGFFGTRGPVTYFDLEAPTNGNGLDPKTPRNTLANWSRPAGEWNTIAFAGGTLHRLDLNQLFADGANLQIGAEAQRRNTLICTYDRLTGERVFDERRVAELQSYDPLAPTTPDAWLGRPVVRISHGAAARGMTVLSGIRLSNPYGSTSYDMVHAINVNEEDTLIFEAVSGGKFPNSPVQGTGYISAAAIKVTGNANVFVRHCSMGDIYGDGLWIERNSTAACTALIEWCDFVLNPAKQNTAGPDGIQFARSGAGLIGTALIQNCWLEGLRNQKALVIVSGGTRGASERLTARGNLCFGADTSTVPISSPEVAPQVAWNLDMDDVEFTANLVDGTAMWIKAGARLQCRSNVFIRQADGTHVAGTTWFTGIAAEGADSIVDRNTCLAYGPVTVGTAISMLGATSFCRNNVIAGRWGLALNNSGGADDGGGSNYIALGDDSVVDALVDRLGRPVPGSALLASVPAYDTGPGPDFFGSTSKLPVPSWKGALQVLSTSEPNPAIPAPAPRPRGFLWAPNGAMYESPSYGPAVPPVPLLMEALASRSMPTAWARPNAWNSTGLIQVNCAVVVMAGTAAAVGRAYTAGGTVAQRSMTLEYPSTAATANTQCGVRLANGPCIRGSLAGEGGFYSRIIYSVRDAASVADARSFFGLHSGGDIAAVNPSTLLSLIGIGNDGGQANLQLITNDASGTATMVDLGASFPANTVDELYELDQWCVPNDTGINWRLRRLSTGHQAQGRVTADLPANNLQLTPKMWRSNGATALAVRLGFYGFFVFPHEAIN